MLRVDFTVVGGGPAGAAMATLLAIGGAKVALVEAGDFARFRAGEALDLEAQRRIARLGFQLDIDPARSCPATRPVSKWGEPLPRQRSTLLAPVGVSRIVDRQWLDKALFEHAGLAGAQLHVRARIEISRRQRGRWQFRIRSEAGTVSVSTPTVIEATGRTGRSVFSPDSRRHWVDRLVALALVLPDGDRPAETCSVESIPEGWLYRTQLPGRRRLTMLFTDADLLVSQRDQMVSALRHHDGARLGGAGVSLQCPIIFDARTGVRRVAAADGWFAVGDALMAVDPLSGSGLAIALRIAERAASCALEHPTVGRDVPEWLSFASDQFNRYLEERQEKYTVEQRWSGHAFWRRRQAVTAVTSRV